MHSSPPVWRLKKGFDRRFVAGHPWVFSNELASSPKGLPPGAKVELQGPGGEFLAHGFGNPHSLIAFREVSRSRADAEWDSAPAIEARLRSAYSLRLRLGLGGASFRWIHGETDGFSGLIVDRYELVQGGAVIVLQCHSAGMDRIAELVVSAARAVDPSIVAAVLRNDVSSRKHEGLAEEVRIAFGGEHAIWSGDTQEVLIRGLEGSRIPFSVDLRAGQKTGFFLDQTENIHAVIRQIRAAPSLPKRLRVLDLCTYVGQWSAQFAHALAADPRTRGVDVSFTLVDVSARALGLARKNVERHGFPVATQELDVLKELDRLEGDFNLIVCDPPALIQNRKHHPVGFAAYAKLNREALKKLAAEGFFVTCSCSQLLSDADFAGAIAKAERTSGVRVSWVLQGTQAVDHPLRMEFPEGHYLKMHAGIRV